MKERQQARNAKRYEPLKELQQAIKYKAIIERIVHMKCEF